MTLYYSASAPGFFDSAIHETVPDDAVEITPARHHQLLAAQAEGRPIRANAKGGPIVGSRPKMTAADSRAQAKGAVKREASRRINAISPQWRQMNDMRIASDAGSARFAAIDAVRAASDAIEQEIDSITVEKLAALDIEHHIAWPE